MTSETTKTTIDTMDSFVRRQQARHRAARKFDLCALSDVEIPGILLSDIMNTVELPGVVLNKKTLGRDKKTVTRKENTCDVEVPEDARKFAFGVVSNVEVSGVFLNNKTNDVDAPVVVLKKKNMGRKRNICDV